MKQFATLRPVLLATACLALLPGMGGPAKAADAGQNIEGMLVSIRPAGGAGVELDLMEAGTNQCRVSVNNCGGNAPTLFSRIHASAANVPDFGSVQLLTGSMQPLRRDLRSLRQMGEAGQHAQCVAALAGQVLAASKDGRFLALQDATGVMLLELKLVGRRAAPGDKIEIQGNCIVEGPRAIFYSPPLVDDDDIHAMQEASGKIYLTPGRHQLRLDWFNRAQPYGLEVYYSGPDLPRRRIPAKALFQAADGASGGLVYRCYEGSWLRIPDFESLIPAASGTVSNFDLTVITRPIDVGMEFKGFIDVRREGLYTFYCVSDDGSLLFMDERTPLVAVKGTNSIPGPNRISPRQSLRDDEDPGWAQAEGVVKFAAVKGGRLELELNGDMGRMRAEIADSEGIFAGRLLNERVRLTGICLRGRATGGNLVAAALLAPGPSQIELWKEDAGNWVSLMQNEAAAAPAASSNALPTLTDVEQVKRLNRDQWQRAYPVKIRGVITTVLDSGVFIQDSTGSIYARWRAPTDNDVPRVGEYWEIQGSTFAEFAPNIQVTSAQRLGPGALPEPLRPAWDQLINGSLDTEYVEVEGIVAGVSPGGMTLLTRAGRIELDLLDLAPQATRQYDNALIRVRGCVIPVRNFQTQQVEPGRIRLSNVSISEEEPAPKDPFATPLKQASDLLLFDWRAGAFQRVKIAGQFLHDQNGEYFLAAGTNGLRVVPKVPQELNPGDMVEAVGFLELGGPSPVLREAIVRRTGAGRLPSPVKLDAHALANLHLDSTWVAVDARLGQMIHDRSGDALEMQSGGRNFVARLKRRDGPLPAFSPGCLLELSGVYAAQPGASGSGSDIASFDLLLNSAADVKLLQRPPWWTAERAMTVLAVMLFFLLAGLVWIALLRRQVEERSLQLTAEIRRHELTERQREMEEERARIARDLHDDLGADLTQIRFLSAVESQDARAPEGTRARMAKVSEKSRAMVASLDEIVWAINPANDSVVSLANYLSHFANEFFAATPVRCRLDVADALPAVTLTSEVRHHLYLAVRESLNNIVKHSEASEVWLRLHVEGGQLRVVVEDNGHGVTPQPGGRKGEGLNNMRQRMEKAGGIFEREARPDGGTVCRFIVPLDAPGKR